MEGVEVIFSDAVLVELEVLVIVVVLGVEILGLFMLLISTGAP